MRKTIKWTGAAVTVLLVVVWIGSGWCWWRGVRRSNFDLSAGHGSITLWYRDPERGPLGSASGLLPGPGYRNFYWTPFRLDLGFTRQDLFGWRVNLPIWPLASAASLIAITAWRLDTLARRRARLNLCPKCNYDRTGLTGGPCAICPECGTASTAP
jgi:hypothetical protein